MGKDVCVLPCATFREVVKLAANPNESDGGFMAIENSIAGSILPNYSLLQNAKLTIAGEVYLQIHQNLLANPGVQLSDICEVHSHPMAFLQCLDFLEGHSWKLVETEDTALSAKYIHQRRHKHVAAIAGKLAAELFHLNVLVPKIQSNKANYTRFLYLVPAKNTALVQEANKASLNFQTDHSKGSLAKVLTKIADAGINLSKLQSMPIPDKEWKYSFHADTEFDTVEQFNGMLKGIKPLTDSLTVLGVYKKGETVK